MTTYYISPTGDDTTGDGSIGNPWLTVAKANASSASGDTIFALPGSISWADEYFATPRIITAADPLTTTFDGGGNTVEWVSDVLVSVSNIKFTNSHVASSSANFRWSNPAADWRLTNCIFDGLVLDATPSTVGAMIGMGVSSSANGIASVLSCLFNNLTQDGSGSDVPIFGVQNEAGRFIATNNTFYSNITAADTCRILGRTSGSGSISSAVLKNNIFWNANGTNRTWNIGITPDTYGDSTNNLILGYSSAPSLPNQLSTDPLFVDAANGNFNLRPTSPCINAGVIL